MARELKALLSQLEEWQIARPGAALLEDLEEAKEVDWRLYVHVPHNGFDLLACRRDLVAKCIKQCGSIFDGTLPYVNK